MLSSTMRPTAMASPARLMKLSVQSNIAMMSTVIMMLSGMEMAMISVGRRV